MKKHAGCCGQFSDRRRRGAEIHRFDRRLEQRGRVRAVDVQLVRRRLEQYLGDDEIGDGGQSSVDPRTTPAVDDAVDQVGTQRTDDIVAVPDVTGRQQPVARSSHDLADRFRGLDDFGDIAAVDLARHRSAGRHRHQAEIHRRRQQILRSVDV